MSVLRTGSALGTALALTVALAGCASSSALDSPGANRSALRTAPVINVVASTDVYADIAKSVGGDRVSVLSFISDPDQDPHSYEASAQNQLSVSKADVLIENGGGYDDFVERMVNASRANSTMINVVDLSGKQAAPGEERNEHVWYDFPTVMRLADDLADVLTALDREDAAAFRANAAELTEQVHRLVSEEADLKASYGGDGVAITEPVPLYLLEAIGLHNQTPARFSEAIEEGNDVAALVLKQTLDLFSAAKVRVLVYNEQTGGPITEQVKEAAERAGIPVVPVTETLPHGKSYVTWMTGNLDNLKKALSTR